MLRWREYVEGRVFAPPAPPVKFDPSFAHVSEECLTLYENTSVPSICFRSPVPANKKAFIFFHGNGSNIATPEVHTFASQLSKVSEADVYVPEYPGYADGSTLSEQDLISQMKNFVTAHRRVVCSHLTVVGYSLGSVPALHSAPKADAVVLIAPLVSALSCVLAPTPCALLFSFLWRPFDFFCNEEAARAHGKPQLVVTGGRDVVTPAFHGKRLGGIFVELREATHETLTVEYGTFEAIRVFTEQAPTP